MRAAVVLALALVLLNGLSTPVAAGPEDPFFCAVNGLLGGGFPANLSDCFNNYPAACGEAGVGGMPTLTVTVSCGICVAGATATLGVGRITTSVGTVVSGQLSCGGITVLSATAPSGNVLTWTITDGSLPVTLPMTCGPTGPVPMGVSYAVVCNP